MLWPSHSNVRELLGIERSSVYLVHSLQDFEGYNRKRYDYNVTEVGDISSIEMKNHQLTQYIH